MQAWFSIRYGVGSEESKQASLSAHLIAAFGRIEGNFILLSLLQKLNLLNLEP